MATTIRFFHVGDLHVASNPAEARALLAACAATAPDFIITGGDNTEAGESDQYRIFLENAADLRVPLLLVRGNHDRGHFARHLENRLPPRCTEPADRGSADVSLHVWNGVYKEPRPDCYAWAFPAPEPQHLAFYDQVQAPVVTLRDQRCWAYAFEQQGWKFIVLDSSTWVMGEAQRTWLDTELRRTAQPTIVFIHHSLLPCGNQFDAAPLWDRWELLEVVGRCPFVKGLFHAHLHMNRIWNYRGFTVVCTTYRGVREVTLDKNQITSIQPLETYENGGRGQDFENCFGFVTKRLGRMFRLLDRKLWHFPQNGTAEPDSGFAWAERNCTDETGLEWRFDVPPADTGQPHLVRVNFTIQGKWTLQVRDARARVLAETSGQGTGDYAIKELRVPIATEGLHTIRLTQPPGQKEICARVAYYAFAHRESLRLEDLQMDFPR